MVCGWDSSTALHHAARRASGCASVGSHKPTAAAGRAGMPLIVGPGSPAGTELQNTNQLRLSLGNGICLPTPLGAPAVADDRRHTSFWVVGCYCRAPEQGTPKQGGDVSWAGRNIQRAVQHSGCCFAKPCHEITRIRHLTSPTTTHRRTTLVGGSCRGPHPPPAPLPAAALLVSSKGAAWRKPEGNSPLSFAAGSGQLGTHRGGLRCVGLGALNWGCG